ncbi:hypothetical protein ACPA9J_32965 [Pseudomonas aeruginosa]
MGPWSIVGAEVEIGEGTVIGPHRCSRAPRRSASTTASYQFFQRRRGYSRPEIQGRADAPGDR